jgi:ketosteroid isomerase-like protein
MQYKILPVISIVTVLFTGSVYSQKPLETKASKTVEITRKPVVREFNPAFKNKPEAEIELAEHSLSDAFRTKDAVLLDQLLADTVLVSGLIASKTDFITLLTSVQTNYFSIEKSEMRITVYDDVAISTGIQKADIDLENGSRMSQTIFLNTWKKIDGRWQCIAMAN